MKRSIRFALICLVLVLAFFGLVKTQDLSSQGVNPEKAAMKGDPLWVDGNERLISNMQYSVEHLEAQLTSMVIWLDMAKENPSLYIYGTWLKQLDDEILRSAQDLKDIRKLVGESDAERLIVLDQVERKFVKMRAFIRFGVRNHNQKAIDNGVAILKEVNEIMKLKMDWK